MERIWLERYPAGVDADIDVQAFPSLRHMFEDCVARFPDNTAFISMGARLSYRRLRELSWNFGSYLQNVVKLPRGARVALMAPNLLSYPVALFGALSAGYVVVNCNPLYTAYELERQLKDSGAEALVVIENFAVTAAAAAQRTSVRCVVVATMGDLLGFAKGALTNFVVRHVKRLVPAFDIPGAVSFAEALRLGARAPLVLPELGPDDLAFLQYTGGTTGAPIGAELTHGGVIANVQQGFAWCRPFVEDACETVVTPLPLYHIFALTVSCLLFMRFGAANLLIVNPRDIKGMVRELARTRFTAISGVNTLFNALLAKEAFCRLDFSAMKISVSGGMSLHKAVAEKWKAVTGRTLIEGYGLTECSPAAMINPLDLEGFSGAAGLPMPRTEISIRDEAGVEVPLGQQGELCIKGPQLMRGYWKRPEETAAAFTPDGFLRTGDIVTSDAQGFVRVVDRKKDMILVSGFNVYPCEVEDIVALHQGVKEVGAVGVFDARTGEAVKIVVVKRDEGLVAEDLVAHCRKYLVGYKIPRHIEFRCDLPKTSVGKILRRALREEHPPAPQQAH
ncbi:long-chain-fatty-acid--CoA ligase [Rhodoblastus sphagnicola]|uniref:Long-chain-fatty-acid--CoA ligase n=1 Tax=Rhodoblastus sphagnicola TaxID=333368 RepID=A0A2S6NCE0_9HYPH|nr:AMP-binding protein [Rhodoblastus sphagnicola]MBB4196791.1 long-chain acyl-CoA synthetase [Rhodoblastus sphagnicola]PPQ32290.1 long-chain-fatty-acid--CoA ligase [Rhodoblastus sphagnicola]